MLSASCLALQHGQHLVRITLLNPSDDEKEEAVLWNGPSEEILGQHTHFNICKASL